MLKPADQGQAGVGLVELLMGILVGLVLLGGVISVYVATSKANADNLKLARLNQEMRAIMGIMTREIRRAGYWAVVPGTTGSVGNPVWMTARYSAGAGSGTVDLSSNPFWQAANDLAIGQRSGEAANSCITFSYDLDGDRLVGNAERFGFRLNNGVVEMRTSATGTGCDNGTYEPMNNAKLTYVTQLAFALSTTTFNLAHPGSACVAGQGCQSIRQVSITLTLRLLNDATVTQTIVEPVRVRNDLYIP